MLAAKVLVAMTVMVAIAESTIVVGVVGGGAALAGLLGLKALLVGGFAAGALIGAASRRRPSRKSHGRMMRKSSHGRMMMRSSRRHGRSVEDEIDENANAILDASLNDEDDCAKKLVCSLNAQDIRTLQADEVVIATLFGKSAGIDLSAATVEFDLAALMGRQTGKAQCDTIYARCPYQTKDLMEVMRKQF